MPYHLKIPAYATDPKYLTILLVLLLMAKHNTETFVWINIEVLLNGPIATPNVLSTLPYSTVIYETPIMDYKWQHHGPIPDLAIHSTVPYSTVVRETPIMKQYSLVQQYQTGLYLMKNMSALTLMSIILVRLVNQKVLCMCVYMCECRCMCMRVCVCLCVSVSMQWIIYCLYRLEFY